ncbi:MAG: hypothetical protein HY721_20060 [Planctomycetes bacterium]|nr:hypothetical protein [Planctomycetota bacterium]
MSFRGFLANAPIKLIAVILFAILVPSVLVTSLGLVAVFLADAFVRDSFSEPVRAKVEVFRQRLEADWSARLSLYADSLRDASGRRAYLGELRRGDPWVRDVLVSTASGLERAPDPPPPELWSPGAALELRELERLELVERKYPEALAECRRLHTSSRDDAVLVEALLAAARLSYWLGSPQESERQLREALKRYGHTVDSSGMVRAVPILGRIAEIQREEGRLERLEDTLGELEEALARYRGVLGPEAAGRFAGKLAALRDARPEPAGGPSRPVGPASAASAGPRAEPFSSEALARLAEALPRPGTAPGAQRVQRHIHVPDLGDVDVASFPSGDGQVVVHLVLDRETLRAEALEACALAGLPPEGLRLVAPAAPAPAPERGPSLAAGPSRCPAPLENLELAYVPPPGVLPAGFQGFYAISLATFTWAVIVLVITIVVGALFTMRAVLKELRTARLKSDFVSFITHELKTPLTAIRMFTETILAGRTEGEEETRQCLEMIGNETQRLSKLIDQVLEFSRIEHHEKKFRFTTCDMEDVVREAVRVFEDLNRLHPREVEVNSAQHISKIKMDRAAMVELLLNLLSNAAKYSPPDRRIVVNLRETIDDICVEVVDRGIGIRKRDQKRIFREFYRAEDYLTREVEGTGLGLTFARYIAKVHNGDIKVSSQVNAGSTFTLQLRKTHVLAE